MTQKINLLGDEKPNGKQNLALGAINQPLRNNKLSFKKIIYLFIFLFICLAVFFVNLNRSDENSSWLNKIPLIGQLKFLAESADSQLKGEDRGYINILLLGMGGKDHDGGYLTDTIMLVSIEPKTKKVALMSIPRDLAVPIENMGWRKINNVNAFAEAKKSGSGGLAVSQTISDLLKVPIDYYVRVDFTGFEKIINDLGGVKVNVPATLDDYKYPIMGNEEAPYDQRYEYLHVDQGWQQMDGGLALKYVRSRHALGSEGSDFARSRRQQIILQAVKDKFLNYNLLFNPAKIANIIGDVQDNFNSNLKIWEIIKLWNLIKDTKNENIMNKVLDNSPGGLLYEATGDDGAYLLLPRGGDFSEIQYLVNNLFSAAPVNDKAKVKEEKATVEVRNGTWINGLANEVALDLEKYGFDIIRVGNSSQQNFQKSVIYDLTYGEKIGSLTVLKNKTGANVALGMPQWLMDDLAKELAKENIKNPKQPDFILILGQEADTTKSGTENQVQ